MACKICGRNSYTESFHSAEAQGQCYEYADKTQQELITLCIEKDGEIRFLRTELFETDRKLENLQADLSK